MIWGEEEEDIVGFGVGVGASVGGVGLGADGISVGVGPSAPDKGLFMYYKWQADVMYVKMMTIMQRL